MEPTKIEQVLQELEQRLAALTPPQVQPAPPEYPTVRDDVPLYYQKYSAAVQHYNELCDAVGRVQYILYTLERIRQELANTGLVYTRQQYYSKLAQSLQQGAATLVQAYKEWKLGAEATVKFYHSAQYLLYSYRDGQY
jgi:hypothetical protein